MWNLPLLFNPVSFPLQITTIIKLVCVPLDCVLHFTAYLCAKNHFVSKF